MKKEPFIQLLNTGTVIIFFVLIIAFIILSVILNYHWTRYGILPKNIEKIRLWYFGVSTILFGIMAIALIFILI